MRTPKQPIIILLLSVVVFSLSMNLPTQISFAEEEASLNQKGQALIDRVNELREQRKELYRKYLGSKGEDLILNWSVKDFCNLLI